MQPQPPAWTTLLPYLAIFIILVVRLRRMSAARPMRLGALWIRPGIIALVAIPLVISAPPHSILQSLVLVAALGVGAALGWHQGKLWAITVHAESGKLQVQPSFWAMAVFFAVLMLRLALRPWLMGANSPVHAYVSVVTDAFLVFLAGMYGARATEMFIRGRALLQQASRTQSAGSA
jgi:tellurite resistance protein TehA-like permease